MKLTGPGFYLSKKVGRAMADYRMLSEGDRIAVGVSGGKDSLSLLHILRSRQGFCPIKYQLVAVHIDLGNSPGSTKRLRDYFKRSGYKYRIKKLRLYPENKSSGRQVKQDKSCFWCSWNRRKLLFETAAEYKCNKVALGHHLDDIIQTILLNLFFNSEISAMSPKQELFSGQLTLIRPLAYVDENEIISFTRQQKLPYSKYSCANSLISNRRRVAGIIRDLEKICPNLKTNIFRSIRRIKKDYLL
ncbi:ATP-binding protein [Candidatus Omnitrophota bacterium]